MGSKQARGPQGEGVGARNKRMQGDWSPLKACEEPKPFAREGWGEGVKCEGADAGWKRDFTSPMC